jgi:hypothetical protein
MLNITNLFGKSPFSLLKRHLDAVEKCVLQLPPLMEQLKQENFHEVQKIAATITTLEHAADELQHQLKSNIPGKLFFSIPKSHFLEIVSTQNAIGDSVGNAAMLISLRPLPKQLVFLAKLHAFVQLNIETFLLVKELVSELPNLVESSFGGIEAEKLRLLHREISRKEDEIDGQQRVLLGELLDVSDTIRTAAFYQLQKFLQEVGSLSNISEKLAELVCLLIEV